MISKQRYVFLAMNRLRFSLFVLFIFISAFSFASPVVYAQSLTSIKFLPGTSAAACASGSAGLYYDSASASFKVCTNGGTAYSLITSATDANNATLFFNNMGQPHSTQTDFNSVTDYGVRYLQGSTNGPGTGSTQFYGFSLGLGSDYTFGSYAMQLAIPRFNSTDKYISMRSREGGTWGSWMKISAGYADTAGSATDSTKVAKAGDTMTGSLNFSNYGIGIQGVYSATRYQAVFAMSDTYKLPADGSTTGNLYGLAWSHPNAGGVAANLNTHGLLVMENGTFLAAVSGSIRARDDIRAPLFYDSNDTTYSVDPNNTSYFNDARANIFYDKANTAFYLDPSATNSLKVAGNIQAQGGTYITHTPWVNVGAAGIGYIKLITPIVDNESNMFTLKITGYHYGGSYVGGGNSFTINCSGYAYGAGTPGSALVGQGCATNGTSMPVEIGVENRGGVNKVVVRMGTPTASWYYNHFTVDYIGWAVKEPTGFSWVTGETTPSQTGNTNKLIINNTASSITFGDGTTQTTAAAPVGSGVAKTGDTMTGILNINAGDSSYTLYGPNASWAGKLYVGATPNKAVTQAAQVIATDGNLHLDPAPLKNIYIGYYQGRDIYINAGAGNVGIGTTAPGYKLTVAGDIQASGTMYQRGTYTVCDSGNNCGYAVGSNYVLKAGDTMTGSLTMGGNSNIAMSTTGYMYSTAAAGNWFRPYDGGNMHLRADAGGMYFDNNSAFHFRSVAGNENMRINLNSSIENWYRVYHYGGAYFGSSNQTNIETNGNIYAPNYYYVSDNAYGFVGRDVYADTINSGVSGDTLEINYRRPGPTKICATASCGTFSAWFGTDGNVGIGTTAPTYKFQVQKLSNAPAMMIGGGYAGSPRLQLFGLDADANAYMGLGTDMGGGPYEMSIYTSNYGGMGKITFGTYNGTTFNQKMVIDNSGNVGIGTNVPRGTLDVSTPLNNVDGIVIGQINGDNTNSIQSYIDNQWAARATYAGGCCNMLYIQKDAGQLTLGNAANGILVPGVIYDAADTSYYVDPNSVSYLNDIRPNILYDRQDTAYYLDPNGTSRLNNLTVSGTLSGTVSNADTVDSMHASSFFQYEGFTLDANWMGANRSGFTYSVGAPWTGPVVRFNSSNYDLELNANYGGGTGFSYRTKNGDNNTWNSWYRIYSDTYRPYADSAGNADTVDSQHFAWSNASNSPTYLWGADSNGSSYLAARTSLSVGYANSAGNSSTADKVNGYSSNPDNSHPGTGLRPFYSWNTGCANNGSGACYSNGISVGSHPGDQAYGFQIVQNMWDDQLYFRRYNSGWQGWRTVCDNSNNCGYATGSLSNYVLKSGDTMSGNLKFNNYGIGVVGTYTSTRYQAVFAMDSSYMLPADGSTTGSLYGLAWSHPNAGGVASNLNSHGLLVMENGTFLAAISGSIRARDNMQAPLYYDKDNTAFYLDPAGSSRLNQLYYVDQAYIVDVRPQYMFDWNDAAYYMDFNNTSRINILQTAGTITVGGGAGKIDVGTVDPPYTIDGKKYATYVPSMSGVKEEATGNVKCQVLGDKCSAVLDLKNSPEASDLWLFAKTTNLANEGLDNVTVLVSPNFDGRTWYEKKDGKIIVYAKQDTKSASKTLEISYRLTAPRFDHDSFGNRRADTDTTEGFNLDKLIK